jgi:hypothetical protein
MTKLFALVLACGVASLALPAEAHKSAPRAKSKAVITRVDEDSSVCIRAQAEDPAGNYRGYPCWAQAAFGPRRVGGR